MAEEVIPMVFICHQWRLYRPSYRWRWKHHDSRPPMPLIPSYSTTPATMNSSQAENRTAVLIMPLDQTSASDERSIDIGGRTYQLYWCYQCHRTVRIASDNPQIMCPRCFGQFVYEIDIARPRLVVEFTEFDPSPEARILEALSLMLDPPVRHGRRFGIQPPWHQNHGRRWPWRRNRAGGSPPLDDADGWGSESGILARPRSRSWIILTPNNLPMADRGSSNNINNNNNIDDNGSEGVVPRGIDPRNYFNGYELNGLIEELTQNDRPGPPPVPDPVINGLPIVKIMQSHLLNDSQSCAVCMDDFKVGGEAKELPCNHIFHSDCIGPWLRLHNSCPVCRTALPVPSITTDGTSDSSDDGTDSSIDGRGRRRRRRCLRWRRLASVWPFQTRCRPPGSHRDPNVSTRENSRVHSCNIL